MKIIGMTPATVCVILMMSSWTVCVVEAFTPILQLPKKCAYKANQRSSTSLFGTNRKARRLTQNEEIGKSRPNTFYDAIKETENGSEKKDKDIGLISTGSIADAPVKSSTEGKGMVEAKPRKMKGKGKNKGKKNSPVGEAPKIQEVVDDRPEVTTVIVDEATGIERIAQGKAVMDVVTRKAVKLSDLGPQYRLAQMFPGVPPDIREKHRFTTYYDPKMKETQVEKMIQLLEDACMTEKDENGKARLPPHPTLSNNAIDFVLANRDLLTSKMKKTLGRIKMRYQSLGKLDEAKHYRDLWKHFLTLEDHISAPFRQMMLDAESKVGPNFGNLDLKSYVGTETYERAASYLVLKGMVAHWEKKVKDAEYFENTPQTKSNFITLLSTGDPKRYLPDPPIIFRYNEVLRVASMAQQMVAVFVNDTALFDDLPVEVRFIESALRIKGGTALRKFVVEDFCPAEEITPAALREGLRRLDAQLENMQIDPYGDIKNTVGRLCEAMAVGTDEEYDPYAPYLYNLDSNGPGYFQTYTFNHDRNSLVRFLDNAKTIEAGSMGNTDDIFAQLTGEAKMMFGFGGNKSNKDDDKSKFTKGDEYVPPAKRSLGRPHMTGWLDWLDEDKDEDATFEADNWREIKK